MKVIGFLLLVVLAWFVITCVSSFCVMMGINNIHEWWMFVPTISFWQAFPVTAWFAIPLAIYAGYSKASN